MKVILPAIVALLVFQGCEFLDESICPHRKVEGPGSEGVLGPFRTLNNLLLNTQDPPEIF